jgi:hypothetical protein
VVVDDHLAGSGPVCLDTMFGTYLALGPGRASARPNSRRDWFRTWRVVEAQLPMHRTYLALDPSRLNPESTRLAAVRDYRCTGHTWPFEADPPRLPARRLVGLSITMYRTYLAARDAFSGRSTLAILETYEACVHHDRPSILGACTHDEPDILLAMYRTYLARALTMYRTYHYR